MDGSSPALPHEWISRLFGRFRAIYGNQIEWMFGSTAEDATEKQRQMNELVATWATELGRYEGDDLRRALEAMRFAYKDRPPNLYQFADLCRDALRARTQSSVKLAYARPNDYIAPEVLAEIHKVSCLRAGREQDPRDWARRILQRVQAGEKMPVYALFCAREALGIAPTVQ